MNKVYMAVLVALLSFGLGISAAYAGSQTGKSGLKSFDSSDLIGVPVKNSQGRFLGLVNGIMVASDGEAFAVVNHGDYDLYGSGGVNTPVPIAALKISETKTGKEMIALNTDTEHMDFAPYLDPTKTNDRQYVADIDGYFGVQPAWNEGGACSK